MNKTENSPIDQDTVAIPLVELAGLVKAADKLRNVPLPPLPREQGTIAGLRYWDMYSLQQHARTAIALHARQAKPFMYAIQGPDGEAHIEENCVAGDPDALAIEVNGLNDSPDAGYSIVPVYLGAGVAQAPKASKPRQPMIGRLLDEFAALPVLWGLGEPGALVRQGQVFDMMVKIGKEYAPATQSVQQPAPVAGQEPERFDTEQSREYLVRFMEQHFTDKTFHRYIRAARDGNSLAGDFAWQMARALRIIQAAPVPAASVQPQVMRKCNRFNHRCNCLTDCPATGEVGAPAQPSVQPDSGRDAALALIMRDVCELDYSSGYNDTEMLAVTTSDLRLILERHIANFVQIKE